MLMNLTRIRAFTWLDHMNDYYQTYKYNITWGDQDLLNVLFHYYPGELTQHSENNSHFSPQIFQRQKSLCVSIEHVYDFR